jgi:hypothetical protein
MSGYLLDTNVVSELRRRKPHGAVTAWLRGLSESDIFISAVTLGEIQSGIELTRGQDAEKAAEIEAWLDDLAANQNILPMDGRAFRTMARLLHRKSDRLIEDAMIAATAAVHGLTVATRNIRDFRRLGVPASNPFEAADRR